MKALLYILPLLILSCVANENKTKSGILGKISQNDEKLESAKPGEWLYEHKEKGQTIEQYKSIFPISPNQIQNIIYIQPIGNFDSIQTKLVNYTAEYLQIYFGLKTIVSTPLEDNIIPKIARRQRENGSIQLLAPYILDTVLKQNIPKNAIVVMAITEKDIYPKPSWNYVFGLSSFKDRIAVTSMYRFSDHELNASNYSLCLERLIKISSHEIGHMFTMYHCINALCLMNGTNSLSESDEIPNRLCSECLGKLTWNLKFNNEERLYKLKDFFYKHQIMGDYDRIKADLALYEQKN